MDFSVPSQAAIHRLHDQEAILQLLELFHTQTPKHKLKADRPRPRNYPQTLQITDTDEYILDWEYSKIF